ncbi:type IV pilus assembly protein PilM [Actinotalea fermentans]|uniref:Pilus assembly protein PilM n=1 Tax=Actinotalea fermentans TaxID=43671 RepID=A0A511YUH9_9CELL|nr:type IV pilus assembly protein PilM [Actinotalea fermentans]KGM17043.1 pilus assembly protein PilM [Actinotalea fermentans ATCC 43279 = JCM 9966 = DSM 3133]GEN78854.1 pilus assembly protein PilM [Actinotalea fermentans]
MAKVGVVGLDIGTSHVRAAEVQPGPRGGAPTLVRYAEAPLPAGAVRDGEVEDATTVASAIRSLWSSAKFPTRNVNIGVGNQRVVVRALDLPWMPLPQLRGSLAFQVQDLLPMSTDDALMDYYPTGEVDAQTGRMLQGMLVAATRDTVRANVMAVEAAGLRPQLVDLNPFALLRAVVRGDLVNRTVAVVDVGARITQLVIASRGMPRFVRILPSGGQSVTDAVASALGIAGPEAENVKRQVGVGYAVAPELAVAAEAVNNSVRPLVEAVRNTFVYYAGNHHGDGIDVVVLTGGGCHLPGLGQYLSSASRLPVTLGDPLSTMRVAKSLQSDALAAASSTLAMPIGLALGVAA